MNQDQLLQLAIAHHQAGRLADAEGLYRQVLGQNPNHPTALHLLGVLAGQSGRADVAVELIRRAIGIHPTEFLYHVNLATFLSQLKRPDEAIVAAQHALQLNPHSALALGHLGGAYRAAGRLNEAAEAFNKALALEPANAQMWLELGNTFYALGRRDEAAGAYRHAITLKEDFADAHGNLATVLKDQQRLPEAIASYQRALVFAPNHPVIRCNMGASLLLAGRTQEAIAAYRRAIELKPDYPEAHTNLGIALVTVGDVEGAVAAHEAALRLRPDFPEALNNLGIARQRQDRLDDAIAAFERAIALNPRHVDAMVNLGGAYKEAARMDDALAAYRRAAEINPQLPDSQANTIFALMFHPHVTPAAILNEARDWAQKFAPAAAVALRPKRASPEEMAGRKIRIGYVSPDFRDHCQALFTVPLLEHHDRQGFHITLYSGVVSPDAVTQRIKKAADVYRATTGLSDDALAALIRADQIDILIDLTMHMAGGRLRMFAQRPAPVQACWLAYPGTTGIPAMDFRISDPYLDPPDGSTDRDYSEKTIRLPHTFWCYDPLIDLPLTPLPADAHGFVTFGCLNNFCKVNDGTLELWAGVLRGLPDSRLMLLAPLGRHRERVLNVFKQHGVDAARVEFVSRSQRTQYLLHYHQIDIALDTFPVNGHTTSLDSYHMGVPVVTWVSPTNILGRAGLSQLMNLGLPELIARTPEEFTQRAVDLARNREVLRALRETLRQKMQSSPLMDAAAFARDMEAAYRTMLAGTLA